MMISVKNLTVLRSALMALYHWHLLILVFYFLYQETESLTVHPISYKFRFNSRFSTELRIVSRFLLIEMRN